MVVSCSAYNCTQRWEKGISFHKFPKDKELFQKWIHAVRRQGWTPSKTSVICSRHFTGDCYEQSGWSSLKKLKAEAVPSIFSFPEHLQKSIAIERAPPRERNNENVQDSQRSSEDSASSEIEGNHEEKPMKNHEKPKIKKKRMSYIGDFDISNQTWPEEAVKCLTVSKQVISVKNKEIKTLKQKNRRLQKKIDTLETLVKHLRSKDLTSEEGLSVLAPSEMIGLLIVEPCDR